MVAVSRAFGARCAHRVVLRLRVALWPRSRLAAGFNEVAGIPCFSGTDCNLLTAFGLRSALVRPPTSSHTRLVSLYLYCVCPGRWRLPPSTCDVSQPAGGDRSVVGALAASVEVARRTGAAAGADRWGADPRVGVFTERHSTGPKRIRALCLKQQCCVRRGSSPRLRASFSMALDVRFAEFGGGVSGYDCRAR